MIGWTVSLLFMIVALSSHETFANESNVEAQYRKSRTYRATARYLPPPFVPLRSTGLVRGCYGFDHGPIYGPYPCNFPYPCEYYGTCKGKPKGW
jgi:hypothetical protein